MSDENYWHLKRYAQTLVAVPDLLHFELVAVKGHHIVDIGLSDAVLLMRELLRRLG